MFGNFEISVFMSKRILCSICATPWSLHAPDLLSCKTTPSRLPFLAWTSRFPLLPSLAPPLSNFLLRLRPPTIINLYISPEAAVHRSVGPWKTRTPTLNTVPPSALAQALSHRRLLWTTCTCIIHSRQCLTYNFLEQVPWCSLPLFFRFVFDK